ncbi:hypothetical protein AcV5_004134 [Taiwanofungus camphoratus]|nr:hypothetical protein AcV5_004134 [Antrodia cinnamomea]
MLFYQRTLSFLSIVRNSRRFTFSVPSLGPSGRVHIPEIMEIKLSEDEAKLCTLLDECTQWMREKKGLETSCRIAGGWVRDKLLGMQSNDIDVALSDMMGMTFAKHFVSYCTGQKHIPVKGIARVESNPDQSKHLETAKTSVLGLDIDFVNLRSEEYSENSRIPTQVNFGTPLQDALRRDITINALFYNVHARSVEDFTGKGLDDLRNGIVRTPLPPKETFTDDPLRVIRCVRFASRFGFEMVPELQEAGRDPEIQGALTSKISRERVGEEVDKMMKGRDPLYSVKLINDLCLYSSIFHVPEPIAATLSAPLSPLHTSLAAASILDALLQRPCPSSSSSSLVSASLPPVHPLLLSDVSAQLSPVPRLFLACALTPFRGIAYNGAKDKTHPAVEAPIREGLKLGTQNHYLDGIPALFAAADLLSEAVSAQKHEALTDPPERVKIGLLLRNDAVHNPSRTGSTWPTSLLFSLVQDLVPLWDATHERFDSDEAAKRIGAYNAFVSRIEELGLPALVDAKPMLDGREVVQVLGASKPGPWTGQVLSRVVEWRLEHPEGTKGECEAWLRAEHAAGRISVDVGPPASKRVKGDSAGSTAKKAKR